LQVTGYKLQVAGRRSPVTGYPFRGKQSFVLVFPGNRQTGNR